jgi:hypothetical protein
MTAKIRFLDESHCVCLPKILEQSHYYDNLIIFNCKLRDFSLEELLILLM